MAHSGRKRLWVNSIVGNSIGAKSMGSVWYWRIGIAVVLVVLWWITRDSTHMI
jgi:hypothetical protein